MNIAFRVVKKKEGIRFRVEGDKIILSDGKKQATYTVTETQKPVYLRYTPKGLVEVKKDWDVSIEPLTKSLVLVTVKGEMEEKNAGENKGKLQEKKD